MRAFNLSEWALTQSRAWCCTRCWCSRLIGAWSYRHLGQSEDPPFTFKAMVVRTLWPGATAQEVSTQVTERIEKKLMETGQYEYIRSYSRPGESQVIFVARDSMTSHDSAGALVPGAQEDRRHPAEPARGRRGPVLQRRVRRHLRQHLRADRRRLRLRGAEGLRRAHPAGTAARARRRQGRADRPAGREDLDRASATPSWPRWASRCRSVQEALEQQNAVLAGGLLRDRQRSRAAARRTALSIRCESIRDFPIRAGDRTIRLGDIAEVQRGFSDPAAPKMRFRARTPSASRWR